MRFLATIICASSAILAGCAHTPDVTADYYLPRGDFEVKVTRTVGCDSNDNLFIADHAEPKMTYSRDVAARRSFRFGALNGIFNDANLGITYYDDGRLMGVNATTTGRGKEIVASAISLARVAFALALDGAVDNSAICASIRAIDAEDPVSLSYVGVQRFAGAPPTLTPIALAPGRPARERELAAVLPPLCLFVGNPDPVASRPLFSVAESESTRRNINLELRHPAAVPMGVIRGAAGSECPVLRQASETFYAAPSQETVADGSEPLLLWNGTVDVPQLGVPYNLPIPRAALFGQQVFKVKLSSAGAVTSLTYDRTSGAAAALDTAAAIGGELQPATAAERAAELRAQADLIAQQQRLIRCEMDRQNCS